MLAPWSTCDQKFKVGIVSPDRSIHNTSAHNSVVDALSRKERVKPRRVQAMAMTIQYGVRGMILVAQSEAFKQKNVLAERHHGLRYLSENEIESPWILSVNFQDNSKEWNSGDDQLRFRWMIYLVVLANAAESVSDAIRFEYCLDPQAYGQKSPVIWVEIGGSSLIGPELVQETTDKEVLIKEKLKAARDHQKSYADNRRPFEILERIGPVAYRLRLPEELSGVHETFHVSNLKKCLADASLHVPLDEIKVDEKLNAKWLAVRYLVKVSWNSKCNFKLTWVWEDYLKDKYPRFIVWSPVLWAEIGESSLIGPELVQETTDKVVLIKEKLKAARDRQKSYADNRRKPLEFEVGDRVMLKVSPCKGVVGFGKKGKLAPSLHVPLDEIKVDKTLHFVEELVENSDREIKRLKCSRMVVVKIVDSEHGRLLVVDHGTRYVLFSLIPLSRGSFDVIVGMDWLSKRKFVIVCHEKVVRIPLEGNEILQVHGERTQGVVKTLNEHKEEKHRVHLKLVLKVLRKEKLYAKSSVKDKILATLSQTSKVENAPAEMLCKTNVVIDVLRRKERVKPRRVRAMAMTIQYGGMIRTIVMDEAHASSLRYWSENEIESPWILSVNFPRSPVLWAEIGESSLIGPELVQETTDKVVLIKEKLKAARDRQKSYADNRRKPLEFEVGDRVMLKVSPCKGVVGFGKKGKLAPSLHVPLDEIKVDKTLRFVEELVENSDREIKRLKCSRMVVVKVHLGSKRGL
ncbi:hypothetical protein Tco_1482260 [Tanacetum coccineum]